MIYRWIGAAALAVFAAGWNAAGWAQTPYYAGKTITIVAGTKAGDVYDTYARHFAQYLPKYIPGSLNIIVQNMAGAGSTIAANFVYNVSKPDGLTIGAIFPALYFGQLIAHKEVQYDWSKFAWLGGPVKSNHLLYMRADSPFKTIHNVVKTAAGPKCGASGTSSTSYYVPKLLDEVIGTNFDIVLGYQAGQDIDLAVERNELVCRAFTITAFFAREPFATWRKKNFVNVLVQTGSKRDGRLKEVPTIYELMDRYKTSKAGRSLATLVLAGGDFGRPYVMPPNTPDEQIKIIRTAFEKVLKDEAANADGIKKKLEFDPSTADGLETLVKKVTGYKGTGPVRLAFDAGEVDGVGNSWESMKSTWRKQVDAGAIKILLQTTAKAHPELPQIPLAVELAKSDEAKKMLTAITQIHGPSMRPYFLPPGTPRERVALLRKAFMETMRDPEFLAEAKHAKLDVEPDNGASLEKNVKGIFHLEPALVAKLKEILK